MENRSAALPRRGFDVTSSAFLIVAFLTGIAGALQTPTLSLFLTNEVHVRPAMVGFFYRQRGYWHSGQSVPRRPLRPSGRSQAADCRLLSAGGAGLRPLCLEPQLFHFAVHRRFLSSFGSTANPQMFALAREHADRTGREAVMFSSILRAQVSLAWVIGPPLAYALAMGFGFTAMYLSAAARLSSAGSWSGYSCPACAKQSR